MILVLVVTWVVPHRVTEGTSSQDIVVVTADQGRLRTISVVDVISSYDDDSFQLVFMRFRYLWISRMSSPEREGSVR